MTNYCLKCGEDLGECNPRQLCGKNVCLKDEYISDEDTTEYINSLNDKKINFSSQTDQTCQLCYKNLNSGYTYTNCKHSFCMNCFVNYILKENKCKVCDSVITFNKTITANNASNILGGDFEYKTCAPHEEIIDLENDDNILSSLR